MLSVLIWVAGFGRRPDWASVPGQFEGLSSSSRRRSRSRRLVFLWTLFLLTQFDLSASGLQLQEYLTWIPTLGLNYS